MGRIKRAAAVARIRLDLWYVEDMTHKTNRMNRSTKTGEFTIGLKASASISKVEGLKLSKDMRTTFRDFAKKGVSHGERRSILAEKYGKKGS